MIEQTNEGVLAWLADAATPAPVRLLRAAPEAREATGCVHLFDCSQDHPSASLGLGIQPATLQLRYLVTAWAPDVTAAHALFEKLLVAGLTNPRFTIDTKRLEHDFWKSIGIERRPAFVVNAPATIPTAPSTTPLVQRQPEYTVTPACTISGVVTGADCLPFADVSVHMPFTRAMTRTDARGKFVFNNAPTEAGQRQLTLAFKGRFMMVDVPPGQSRISIEFLTGE